MKIKSMILLFILLVLLSGMLFPFSVTADYEQNKKIIDNLDQEYFIYDKSDTTFGINSKVLFEGVARCVFIVYLSNGDHQCFAFLTLLRTKSDESIFNVDDWQHEGRGTMKLIFYKGFYDFEPATNKVILDGIAGICYARGS